VSFVEFCKDMMSIISKTQKAYFLPTIVLLNKMLLYNDLIISILW